MELALRSCNELLAQTEELAGRPYDAAQARLRDRTAASQRSVRAGGAALLLRPMQIQLPGLREQGRGPQRRSGSDNRRRKSPALQYLRRRPLSGARSVRIGGGSCRGSTSAVAQQARSARRCGSCGPNPYACLGFPAAAFAPRAYPDARKFRQVAGRSARPALELWPREFKLLPQMRERVAQRRVGNLYQPFERPIQFHDEEDCAGGRQRAHEQDRDHGWVGGREQAKANKDDHEP